MSASEYTQDMQLKFSEPLQGSSDYDYERVVNRYFTSQATEVTPESVCGVDNRVRITATTTLPYKAICKLYMKSKIGDTYVGTGWLIKPEILITAGHCVYDHNPDSTGWMDALQVVPGKSGTSEPYGRYDAHQLAATRGWIEKRVRRFDMGAIKLRSAVSHGDFLSCNLSDPATAEVCGYPADRDTGIFQYKMTDTLSKEDGRFSYMIDTFGGQSGSPLLQGRRTAIGIHNYGGCPNQASDLYSEFLDAINEW